MGNVATALIAGDNIDIPDQIGSDDLPLMLLLTEGVECDGDPATEIEAEFAAIAVKYDPQLQLTRRSVDEIEEIKSAICLRSEDTLFSFDEFFVDFNE